MNSEPQLNSPNPAIKELEILIGSWSTEIIVPGEIDKKIKARTEFDWSPGNSFLKVTFTVHDEGFPGSYAYIGRESTTGNYDMMYYGANGNSKIFQMSFSKSEWKIWKHSTELNFNFSANFSKDKREISGKGEKSLDGKIWKDFYYLTSKRLL